MALSNLGALINNSSSLMESQTLVRKNSRLDASKFTRRLSTGQRFNAALEDSDAVPNHGTYSVGSSLKTNQNQQEFAQSMQSSLNANPNFLSITNPTEQNTDPSGTADTQQTSNPDLENTKNVSSQIDSPDSPAIATEFGSDSISTIRQAALGMLQQASQEASDLSRLIRS